MENINNFESLVQQLNNVNESTSNLDGHEQILAAEYNVFEIFKDLDKYSKKQIALNTNIYNDFIDSMFFKNKKFIENFQRISTEKKTLIESEQFKNIKNWKDKTKKLSNLCVEEKTFINSCLFFSFLPFSILFPYLSKENIDTTKRRLRRGFLNLKEKSGGKYSLFEVSLELNDIIFSYQYAYKSRNSSNGQHNQEISKAFWEQQKINRCVIGNLILLSTRLVILADLFKKLQKKRKFYTTSLDIIYRRAKKIEKLISNFEYDYNKIQTREFDNFSDFTHNFTNNNELYSIFL